MRPKQPHHAGFTLIELVVALSIVSLLSVMLLGGYTFTSRAWNRADAAGDDSSEIYGAQSVLRRAVAGIALDPNEVKFTGTATALAFTARFALPGEAPATTAITLDVDQCPEGQCLVLALSRPQTTNTASLAVSTPLVRGISDAAIAYRGNGDDTSWHSEWPAGKGMPSLVRIDVGFNGKGPRFWPTLYLAPPGAG